MSIKFNEFDNFYMKFSSRPYESDKPYDVIIKSYEYINEMHTIKEITFNIYNELQQNLILSNSDNIDRILLYYFLKIDELYHIQLNIDENDYFTTLLRIEDFDMSNQRKINRFKYAYKRFFEDSHKTTKLILQNIINYCDLYGIKYKHIGKKLMNNSLKELLSLEQHKEDFKLSKPYNIYYWVDIEDYETDMLQLYNLLLEYNFIDDKNSLDNFKKFFSKEIDETFTPIIWNKSVTSLLGFIKALKDYGNILDTRNDYIQIKKCFLLKGSKSIHHTPDVLATYYANAEIRTKREWTIIDKIVSKF